MKRHLCSEPILACDCPTIEEEIVEAEAAVKDAETGGDIPPWLTRAEAIAQLEKLRDDLRTIKEKGRLPNEDE